MKRCAPSPHPARALSAEAGFTLVEIMITVVIITVMSAIALPVLSNGMKDRRTRQTAEEIARVFRQARLRAIGRGSAVVVQYLDSTHSFVVREAVMGPPPNPLATCNRLPATSCIGAQWASTSTTTFGSEILETYRFEETPEVTGIKVFLGLPATPTTQVDQFSVCFTPLGRTYAKAGAPVFFSADVMTFAPMFRVWRTAPGNTIRVGLERRVTLLPNGQTRLQTATGTPP